MRKITLMEELKKMLVFDTREYPIERVQSIRSTASLLNLQMIERKYKTETDKEKRVVIVKRVE